MLNNQTKNVDFYAIGFEEMVDLGRKETILPSEHPDSLQIPRI